MDIEIMLFGQLRELAGVYRETIAITGPAPLSRLIKTLGEKHGSQFAGAVASSRGLRILVNGREYQVLEGMETELKDADSVAFLPYIEGG
jgi:MoaD family protein